MNDQPKPFANRFSSSISWDALRDFIETADAGTLSAAAARLGLSPATLGRRLTALESSLGVALFERGQAGYALTEEGRQFRLRAETMRSGADELRQWLDEDRGLPAVHVSAGYWMNVLLLRHWSTLSLPTDGWRLVIRPETRRVQLRFNEADIVLRNLRPTDEFVVARAGLDVQFAAYAGASGAADRWIMVEGETANTPSAHWLRERVDGVKALSVGSPALALEAARNALGRVVLPCFIGDAEPGLQRVSAPIPELAHSQWLAWHPTRAERVPVRTTIDRLAALIERLR